MAILRSVRFGPHLPAPPKQIFTQSWSGRTLHPDKPYLPLIKPNIQSQRLKPGTVPAIYGMAEAVP
jgi:hypothetical protein